MELVSFTSSLASEGTRKEFSYRPLAFIFRRARALAAEPMYSIRYVDREGVNPVLPPRLEFTIQLAFGMSFRSESDRPSARQTRNESHEKRTMAYPHITSSDSERPSAINSLKTSRMELALVMPSGSAQRNSSSINPSIYRNLKQTFEKAFFSSLRSTEIWLPRKTRNSLPGREKHFSWAPASLISGYYQTLTIADHKTSSGVIYSVAKSKENGGSRPLSFFIRSGRITQPIFRFSVKKPFFSEKTEAVWELCRSNRTMAVISYSDNWAQIFNYRSLPRIISRIDDILGTSLPDSTLDEVSEIHSRGGGYLPRIQGASASQLNLRTPLSGTERRNLSYSDGHEREIFPAQVNYRTEKPLQPLKPVSIAEPTPLPINPPKIDIDRLSRDVWNRIEKRIHIERERHGRL
jgi:hypothetical protein